uniref:Capsular polysaccharide synthesis protein n=1 Tax=viral metagenome TaxID=1070528 RepID=A0A6C0BXD7_9ZZZZ
MNKYINIGIGKFKIKTLFIFLSIIIVFSILLYLQNNYKINEGFIENNKINKTIWLLWFQGWENAPYLQKKIAESWELNNPTWTIQYLDMNNLKNYVTDIDYIYDNNKDISYAAKSDIIRLSLLKNHGGVWADSTLLCMQPLDSWVEKAIENSNFWMYHGNGAGMDERYGPASWFIVSKKESYIITRWKEECDKYWKENNSTGNYFWMDELFKKLFKTDEKFREEWNKVPYLNAEDHGSSHSLSRDRLFLNNQDIKDIYTKKSPYVLKYWNHANERLSKCQLEDECLNSNGYYALEMSKRQYTYDHLSNKA